MSALHNLLDEPLFQGLLWYLYIQCCKQLTRIVMWTIHSSKLLETEIRQQIEMAPTPFILFLAFDFCRVFFGPRVIIFFSPPPQRPMTSDFEGFSIPDFIH